MKIEIEIPAHLMPYLGMMSMDLSNLRSMETGDYTQPIPDMAEVILYMLDQGRLEVERSDRELLIYQMTPGEIPF